MAAALNDGLSKCKYDWVARMDSDDISVCDRFEKQFAFLEKNTNVCVLGGAIGEFLDDDNLIQSIRQTPKKQFEILEQAKTRNPMNHVSVVYRKDHVMEIGGYDENFGKLEDYKLWIDLLCNQKIFANLEDLLVKVRIGNGFYKRRSGRSEIRDWDNLQKLLVEKGIITVKKALLNRCCIRLFVYMPKWVKKIAYKKFLRKKSK